MTANTNRILVVDDHPDIRMGLREMIQLTGDLSICGEALTAEEAIEKAVTLRPDLAIVDISLKGRMDGIELIRRLQQTSPSVRILVLSLHEEQKYGTNALAAGALGYVSKTASVEELLQAIHQVLRGEMIIRKPVNSADPHTQGTSTS